MDRGGAGMGRRRAAPALRRVLPLRCRTRTRIRSRSTRGTRRILDAVNATGEVFLSSTRLRGRLVLRVAIGNERTTRDDVALAWRLLRDHAQAAPPA